MHTLTFPVNGLGVPEEYRPLTTHYYFLPLHTEISSIKQAKEQQAAAARRQATPVVGDMRPLVDALPELSQLVAPGTTHTARRKSRKNKA